MEHALITHDFSIAFVAENNSRSTPLLYTITGLWSALAGSILLWGLVLSGYIAAMVWRFRRRAGDPLVGWATLVTYVVAAFFFGLMAGAGRSLPDTWPGRCRPTGSGPNVLLQDNPLVAFHPPLLYLGFVGFTIPFAFAIASLITGRLGEGWQGATRRWTLFAWGFLTVGVLLGAWWSYQVLGWGGFWGWDPVENAAAAVVVCYRLPALGDGAGASGLLRIWNLSLVVAAFSLTILGTFLTRSGVITVGARLLRLRHRSAVARVLRRGAGHRCGSDRLARRSSATHRAASIRRSAGRGPSCSTTCSSSSWPSSCCWGPSSRCSTRPSSTSR
jgi:cytochrome c-type biogenesis protein CcmF